MDCDRNQDKMLIELIKERPILYDSSHPLHRNYIQKNYAWEEVSSMLNTPLPDLKKRWKHFRDHYHKKKKQTQKKSDWKYMHLLSFLNATQSYKGAVPKNKGKGKGKGKGGKSSNLNDEESDNISNISEFEYDENSRKSESSKDVSLPSVPSTLEASSSKILNNGIEDYINDQKQIRLDNLSLLDSLLYHEKNWLTTSNLKRGTHNEGAHHSSKHSDPQNLLNIPPDSSITPVKNDESLMIRLDKTGVNDDNSSNSDAMRRKLEVLKRNSMERLLNADNSLNDFHMTTDNINAMLKNIDNEIKMSLQDLHIGEHKASDTIHRFFREVAKMVELFPPHLASEAKFKIHKSVYDIEMNILGVEDDDDL